jgi:hypothetical protein
MLSAIFHNRAVFQWVKYAVYLALLNNVYLFLIEEIESASALNTSVTSLASVFQIFSTTIDTAAWLVLLIFFELETYVLSDQTLRGFAGRIIRLTRGICLATICVACWGYFAEFYGLLASEPLDPMYCGIVDDSWSLLTDLDQFEPSLVDVCGQDDWLVLTNYERVLAAPQLLQSAIWLAATDFINAAAWILVVVVLEVEVRSVLAMRGPGASSGRLIYPFKLSLYFILFAAAVYWGFEGDLLDFWDAILWLFAFFVIERNVVSWREEADLLGG